MGREKGIQKLLSCGVSAIINSFLLNLICQCSVYIYHQKSFHQGIFPTDCMMANRCSLHLQKTPSWEKGTTKTLTEFKLTLANSKVG